jgi:hypothetical protein
MTISRSSLAHFVHLSCDSSISDSLADPKTGKASPLNSAFAGLAAGGLGSVIGTPADLALIRMQVRFETTTFVFHY